MLASELGELIALIQEEHPDQEFGQARIQVWYAALGDLPITLALEATVRQMRSKPFPPRPGDIGRQVEQLLDGLEGHRRLEQLRRSAALTGPELEVLRWLEQRVLRGHGPIAGLQLQRHEISAIGPGP